ncbi:MAG TPA: orotate phosphoribosyltransferase, partial [Ruminococcaceae bacterium]|nr:orotate phosphoribosyltransferase [Oscillospiraceae bacterium]
MTQQRALQIFEEAGVLMKGHFLLTSGRHSDRYLQCAQIFRNPKYSEEICGALAENWRR